MAAAVVYRWVVVDYRGVHAWLVNELINCRGPMLGAEILVVDCAASDVEARALCLASLVVELGLAAWVLCTDWDATYMVVRRGRGCWLAGWRGHKGLYSRTTTTTTSELILLPTSQPF